MTKIPVCRENSLINAIEFLQTSGVQVLVSHLEAKGFLHELDLTGPLALILGSEGEGVSNAVAQKADARFMIPQVGETESFNVSVAAGIMLYEVMKQRGQ